MWPTTVFASDLYVCLVVVAVVFFFNQGKSADFMHPFITKGAVFEVPGRVLSVCLSFLLTVFHFLFKDSFRHYISLVFTFQILFRLLFLL